jgi:hypothetical protein
MTLGPKRNTTTLRTPLKSKPEKIEHPRVNVDWQRVPPLMLERKLRYKKRKSVPQLQEAEILKNIRNIKDRI